MRAGRIPNVLVLAACLAASGARPSPAAAPVPHLRVDGRAFRAADGSRFAWRGLTSFRLAELVAHGRAAEAGKVLDWAAAHGVTVVRILAMADLLFKLSPADGRQALPRLLSMAAERGVVVEVVALADSKPLDVDLRQQVRAVGAICAAHANCVLEVANEPYHRTQKPEVGDAATLGALRHLVPASVPVSLGAPIGENLAHAGGDYVTLHLDRRFGLNGWRHVLGMANARQVSVQTGKPVVDDEPIGAAEQSQRGRRDSDPTRWLAKGLLARVLGLGATFHYEGGLQSRIPQGREAECFDAWRRGLDALPAALESQAMVKEPGSPGAAVASFDRQRALAVYVAQSDQDAWAVAVGVSGPPGITWSAGWQVAETKDYGGVRTFRAVRAKGAG